MYRDTERLGVMVMGWNAAPELIAAIVIIILIINSSGSRSIPTVRNKLFTVSLWFTTVCLVINATSVLTIVNSKVVPLWINIFINTLYFLIYPLMSILFIIYLLLFMFERVPDSHQYRFRIALVFIGISVLANTILSIGNLYTGWLFSFDSSLNYVRGPLNRWSFVMVAYNIAIGLMFAFTERKHIDPFFLKIAGWFPIISFAILGIQQIYRTIMLSGTAMMVATLWVFLNFQSKKFYEDNLTKLGNRETFTTITDLIVKRNKRADIILISLDDFKVVNDTFGRPNGDAILKRIACMLENTYPHQQVFRYSGDEFAVVITDDADLAFPERLIQKFCTQIDKPMEIEGIVANIEASTALLELPQKDEYATDPINLLDHAIRLAKNKGRSQRIVIDEPVFNSIRRRNQIVDSLKSGMKEEYFHVEYQPIFNSATNRIVGAEALLRMNDPQLNAISPKEFIPLAEEVGVIDSMGLWVMEKVYGLIDRCIESGINCPAISVNFSGRQFFYDQPEKKILAIHHNHGTKQHVKLEITESTFIGTDYPVIRQTMDTLIHAGIGFYLDDFGTGYSNFSTLLKLPFETVKIDKSLISDILKDEQSRQFLKTLVSAISLTGSQVITEGVETIEQVEYLKSIGCNLIQGYVYFQPVGEQKLIELLENANG